MDLNNELFVNLLFEVYFDLRLFYPESSSLKKSFLLNIERSSAVVDGSGPSEARPVQRILVRERAAASRSARWRERAERIPVSAQLLAKCYISDVQLLR